MIKAVIFDIDGTLIDSVDAHAEAWQKAFKEFGREIQFYELRRQVGKGGDTFLPVFLTKKEIEEFGGKVEERRGEIFKEEFLPDIKPFPKVRELFQKIKADGKRIALASSANADELEAYKKIANVEDLIEEETSADDAKKSKPHPDIFQAVLDKLEDINADEAVIIGDTAYDAEAATAAKVKVVGVLTGGWTRTEMLKTGCVDVYKDVAEIFVNYKDSVLGRK
ncbi:MAG TPA: HAD family phosphatase [Pyrinomonadaceae bacterium]|nr:HAD family phosphatase [Pyrinomonadaceae bacterium]